MNESVLKIASSEIYEVGRFKIFKQELELSDKRRIPYSYVNIKEGVCILPFIEPEHRIVCIRQYRHTVSSWELEFPGGFIDDGETPKQAAERELEEETGYKSEEIFPNGFFYPSVGSTNEKIYLFTAKVKEKCDSKLDAGEIIHLEIMGMQALKEKVRNCEFRHGAGLANLAHYILNS
jgi:ADP-ribose pyrophosphatase